VGGASKELKDRASVERQEVYVALVTYHFSVVQVALLTSMAMDIRFAVALVPRAAVACAWTHI